LPTSALTKYVRVTGQVRVWGATAPLQRTQGIELVFRNREHDVPRAVLCHTQHSRARAQDRPRFGLDGGHDSADFGDQRAVAGLIGLYARLCLSLRELCLRCLERIFTAFEFGGADETLVAQLDETLVVGQCLLVIHARSLHG
jgi:hypothetical protein